MKPLLNVCIVLLLGSVVYAQQVVNPVGYDFLDIANVKARVNANGSLFWDQLGTPSYEVPKGGGKSSIFSSSLWFGAIDNSGQLRTSTQTYRQTPENVYLGPIMSSSAYSPAEDSAWNRVWKVNKSVIDNHIQNYMNVGYVVPTEIAEWPGNGDISKGQASQLAPYVDVNQNSFYDPQNGDYPLVPGDQCVFFINNDQRGVFTTPFLPLGAEIHGMLYAFNSTDVALSSATFLRYTVYNRSFFVWNDFYMGQFTDFDLGYFKDDYIGSDSANNYYYAYNGDSIDDFPNGYGLNPPAQGVAFLNQPLNSFIYFSQTLPQLDSLSGEPVSSFHHYNYLRGLWKDGSAIVNNGLDGRITTATGYETKFMFNGNPCTQNGWYETAQPGDRRGIGATGPYIILPGASITLDLALVYAGDKCALPSTLIDIQNDYDSITNNIQTGIYDNMSLQIIPNPTHSHKITVSLKESRSQPLDIKLISLTGQVIQEWKEEMTNVSFEKELSLPESLSSGVYFMTIQGGQHVYTQKLVIME